MAEPIRNPQPFPNQGLEADGEVLSAEIACTPDDPGILASEAAAAQVTTDPRSKVVEMKQAVSQKAEELKDRTAEALDQAKQRASEALDEAKDRAADIYQRTQAGVKDAVQQGREKATEAARRARVRARYYADEYPLQVIAVAAGVGFLVGVFLRIWRSSRYERD